MFEFDLKAMKITTQFLTQSLIFIIYNLSEQRRINKLI